MVKSMAISRKEARPYRLLQDSRPIKYLTENGFSIIRSSEIDASLSDSPRECRFHVQNENGREREIKVCFEQSVIALVQMRRRFPLAEKTLFWLVCAESCLAQYLWDNNDFPPNDRIIIGELPPDEFMLALHWRDAD